MTDGEGRAPSRPPRNDDTIIVETKVIPMNVPARGAGGALAYNFGPPEAAVTSDE
ncbi:MAG: hypothetical protein IKR48_02585 [Kiritimatiellae bacterium]|nr:hypothetical protein [Kiritimatiellia bacterium]